MFIFNFPKTSYTPIWNGSHSLTIYYHTIRYVLIELVILPSDNAYVVIAEDNRVFDIVARLVAAAHRSSGAERVPGIISSHLISVCGSLYSYDPS